MTLRSCARPRRCGRCSPLRLDRRRRATPSRRSIARRDPAGGDRDDGRADDRGGRGGGPRRLPGRLRRRADRRARRAGRRRSRTISRASRRSAASTARARSAIAADDERARARLERAARRRSRRWAGSSPTTTSRTASCRARSCRRCCARSTSSTREHGLRVGNVFHAGDGNLHPLVLYDGGVEGEAERARGARRADPRRLRRRRRLDHRRARRRRRQGVLDAADVRRGRPRGDAAAARARSTRSGSRNPGKLFPTPRLCGEVPGPYRHAPAREGRALQSASDAARRPRARARRPDLHRRGRALPALRRSRRARSRAHGQMLALDPPGDPTIGACLADDLSGPRSHRYGTMRDLVHRRHGRPAGRARRELGRQGREERRRLRPRQALLRLARAARPVARLALRLHPLPRRRATVVRRPRTGRALHRSPLVPSARRHRGRPDARPLRGLPRAVDAQLQALGGEEARAVGGAARAAGAPAGPRALGRARRRRSCVPARASPTSSRRASRRGARSPSACWRRCAARADRRLRPLRLLPADLPDLRRSGTRRWTRRAGGST